MKTLLSILLAIAIGAPKGANAKNERDLWAPPSLVSRSLASLPASGLPAENRFQLAYWPLPNNTREYNQGSPETTSLFGTAQTIQFAALPDQTFGDDPITLTA